MHSETKDYYISHCYKVGESVTQMLLETRTWASRVWILIGERKKIEKKMSIVTNFFGCLKIFIFATNRKLQKKIQNWRTEMD